MSLRERFLNSHKKNKSSLVFEMNIIERGSKVYVLTLSNTLAR